MLSVSEILGIKIKIKNKTRRTDLSFLGLIVAVLWKEMGKDVATAGRQVNKRTLLADTQSSRHRHHHTDRLDQ